MEGDEDPRTAMIELARAYLARLLALRPISAETALAVSSDEARRASEPARAADEFPEAERIAEAARRLRADLEAIPESRLARLARVCGLDWLDVRIVAVLLAPELDGELERGYMYALDDFTKKRPDLRFVARLIAGTEPKVIDRVLTRFDETAPLRRFGLVVVTPGDMPSQMRPVRLADRVVAYFRDHDPVDELVRGVVRTGRQVALDDIVMAPELVGQIERALEDPHARLLLVGPDGSGRCLVVEAVLARAGREVLHVDLAGIVADGLIAERIAAAVREAALRDAALILDASGLAVDDTPRAVIQAIAASVRDASFPVIFVFDKHPGWLVRGVADLVELEVPSPTYRERLALWSRALSGRVDEPDLETVASRYHFTGATIRHAARRAVSTAQLRGVDRVSLDDLGDAARLMFSHRLGTMAQRIPTGFQWSDLVLPPDTLEGLREIVMFARFKPFLLEDWGFSAKLPYGRGVSAILAGPPGTGKTMVAQLLAKEIGYDLYRIDLSQVVNKYIGETEKNLARIFDEAEHSHAVLFFDEADSLFAKRTNVSSANDRYANLEVNYLLQRMETFDGVTLLATNLEQGLDEAFKRRVRFTVQFELPGQAERRALWRSMFPPKVPLAANIDWDLIARQFEMAGGYIKKAALRAALIAAESRRPITTEDLLNAGRHEYREMGRII
ncbi:MAG TPA: AAA family ATPase [Kofleriaceae bacterium]|nr:AAA family ATPase [Kofleriaceae bacterium]